MSAICVVNAAHATAAAYAENVRVLSPDITVRIAYQISSVNAQIPILQVRRLLLSLRAQSRFYIRPFYRMLPFLLLLQTRLRRRLLVRHHFLD